MDPAPFFAYARERQAVLLRRRAGQPRPWSTDPAFANNRFCNVFREDDRTTVWFRENVRDRLAHQPEVLLATVLFRWFNRITTGEAIFSRTQCAGCGSTKTIEEIQQGGHLSCCPERKMRSAWDEFLDSGDTRVLRDAILKYVGYAGPYVTGAYIVKTPNGMDKLDGVLYGVREFVSGKRAPDDLPSVDWRGLGEILLSDEYRGRVGLKNVWAWLCQFPYLGPFMAYEVVSDLRYTALLDRAPDIMTWANAGPGATRGLNRIWGRTPINKTIPARQQSEEMRQLLEASRDDRYWPDGERLDEPWYVSRYDWHEIPQRIGMGEIDWPAWDMRTVEHTLCEFDKHQRVTLGQGRMKQRFVPHAD
jgi:hypothetical protein